MKRGAAASTTQRTRLYRINEAAVTLNLSPKTLWDWLGQRRIAAVRLGRSVRIPETEIDRLIEEGTTPARRI